MNRTYKVAKSLTRGVVVTSEKASSYQGKAVKTVIAAAVATLVAGSAMAASYIDPVEAQKFTLTQRLRRQTRSMTVLSTKKQKTVLVP